MCVQNFDDSRGFAIRITYRISLRSSSLWEPRHPLLKVVLVEHWSSDQQRRTSSRILQTKSSSGHASSSNPRQPLYDTGFVRVKKGTQQSVCPGLPWRGIAFLFFVCGLPWPHTCAKALCGLRNGTSRPKVLVCVVMILPQVHLRKPCYDFTFL